MCKLNPITCFMNAVGFFVLDDFHRTDCLHVDLTQTSVRSLQLFATLNLPIAHQNLKSSLFPPYVRLMYGRC